VNRAAVLLSMQRALLGCVTSGLRVVAVAWDDHRIAARFVYDREDAEHAELVSEVETQVLADFAPEVTTEFTVEIVPTPTAIAIEAGEVCVYARSEPPLKAGPWTRAAVPE
jgi:hypothetical protein